MFKALILNLLIKKRKQLDVSGFTLIELLVSIIVTSIIVGTLLGFLTNILERDRTEQAKVETQEEIQAALNFIANDISTAVYIYDADGLYRRGADDVALVTQLPHLQPNTSRCNPTTNKCTPVLAFWKVASYAATSDEDDEVKGGNSPSKNRAVRCLEEVAQNAKACKGGNKYYYSLVVYYLLQDGDADWSSTSRIVRWELNDGIQWVCRDLAGIADGTRCPINQTATTASQLFIETVGIDAGTSYAVKPDSGFRRFTISGIGNLSQQFNNWRQKVDNSGNPIPYTFDPTSFTVLTDFIDDTPYSVTQDDGIVGNSPAGKRIDINIRPNTTFSSADTPPVLSYRNADCDNPDIGVGVGLPFADLGTPVQTALNEYSQRIPPTFDSSVTVPVTLSSSTKPNPIGLSSFYACVNANKVSARVYIRGNSLARLKDDIKLRPVADTVVSSSLPTSSVRVFGRGVLQPAP
jgi:type II secretory pathway pseudopilin PulG